MASTTNDVVSRQELIDSLVRDMFREQDQSHQALKALLHIEIALMCHLAPKNERATFTDMTDKYYQDYIDINIVAVVNEFAAGPRVAAEMLKELLLRWQNVMKIQFDMYRQRASAHA